MSKEIQEILKKQLDEAYEKGYRKGKADLAAAVSEAMANTKPSSEKMKNRPKKKRLGHNVIVNLVKDYLRDNPGMPGCEIGKAISQRHEKVTSAAVINDLHRRRNKVYFQDSEKKWYLKEAYADKGEEYVI